ncbi:hypothetical protein [Paenibacillus xylanexedens]|uniref:hypothetical protein n=1 Tax=Paenibacillus xylanexedens TaxID=528191 RepID=UPI003CFDFAB5
MVNPRFKQQFNKHSPKYETTHPVRLQDENESLSIDLEEKLPVLEQASTGSKSKRKTIIHKKSKTDAKR